ncbi:MAG: hypothetical protein M3516_03045 [Actinomycetota bacterium]|nr:hypothetical protein [Actinomycetota bacterium]
MDAMRKTWIVAAVALIVLATTSIVIAGHEEGHTSAVGGALKQVKVVRHSFPHPQYPGGQWSITSTQFVDVPGAQTNITVPAGQQGLIIVRFSPSIICQGTGSICEARVLIGGEEARPVKATLMSSNNNWGVLYTERSRGPLGPGTYGVKAQVLVTSGTSGGALHMRSYHLTVERIEG